MEQLLTVKEVADLLKLHPQSVYRLVNSQAIPHIKQEGIGLRFRRSHIEEWLNKGSLVPGEKSSNIFNNQQYTLTYDPSRTKLEVDGRHKGGKGEMAQAKSKTRLNLGYGAIYQRKTKQGRIRWSIDYNDASGKRVQKVVANAQTKEEAVIALQADVFKAFSREFNVKGQPQRLQLGEFADQYLRDYARVNKARGSVRADECYLRGIKEFFKGVYLDEITSQDLEKYKAFRLSQGVRRSTVNRCLAILRKMFNLAVEWGSLKAGQIPKIKFYPEKDNLMERILAVDEEDRLLKCSGEPLLSILVVALNTGMRLSEILSMQWKDVEPESEKIRVPKSKSGRIRLININSRLEDTLKRLRERNGTSPYLFPNPATGNSLTTVKKAFKTACRRAEIKGLRFHDLRHTFASRLVRMGTDLITVKELLGHSSVTITERYTHTLQEQKQRAVELLVGPKEGVLEEKPLRICDAANPGQSEDSLTCSKSVN
jgi:excisionase family DNA binding protein